MVRERMSVILLRGLPLFLTQIKKSGFIERKFSKYLCAHTKGINFALEKKKRIKD